MTRRGALGSASAAAALLLALGHGAHAYWPRERPGSPSAGAETLLASAPPALGVWLAFPHQNLGVLARRVGSVRRWIEALLARPAGASSALPQLGPFEVPPASELALIWDEGGGPRVVMLRAYLAVRLLARAAGFLAGNPWLAGGEVDLGSGQRGRVQWRDGCWWLESAGAKRSESRDGGARAALGPTLALARLLSARDLGPLPAGAYRLARGDQGLELLAGDPPAALPPWPAAASDPAAWRIEVDANAGLSALVLWEASGPVPPFPASAALARGGAEPRRLPGEELLRLAGARPARAQAAGFEIRALDGEWIAPASSLAEAVALALRSHPELAEIAGAEPGRLTHVARRLDAAFRGFPAGALAGGDAGRLASLMAPWADCGLSQIEVWRAPTRVRWRLCAPARVPARVDAAAETR